MTTARMDTVEAAMPTKLVCLPFAGAGASFYYPWTELADQALEVVPLQLPGRERQIDIEPYRDLHRAVEGLLADLRGVLSRPERVTLFGHSLGAVLAYELAHRLAAMPGVEVDRLFVSGSPAPGIRRSRRATGLPDEDFLLRVKEFAGYHDDALDDPELRELILPTLRADVEMHENYVPSTEAPLAMPITSIRGSEDELVTVDDAASWASVTSREFDLTELPGGHMYLTESAAALLHMIASTVR